MASTRHLIKGWHHSSGLARTAWLRLMAPTTTPRQPPKSQRSRWTVNPAWRLQARTQLNTVKAVNTFASHVCFECLLLRLPNSDHYTSHRVLVRQLCLQCLVRAGPVMGLMAQVRTSDMDCRVCCGQEKRLLIHLFMLALMASDGCAC